MIWSMFQIFTVLLSFDASAILNQMNHAGDDAFRLLDRGLVNNLYLHMFTGNKLSHCKYCNHQMSH